MFALLGDDMATASLPTGAQTQQRRSLAWAFYDWANSAVVTLVIAAVFPVFYNQVIAANEPNRASIFAYTGAIALLLSLIAAPIIGSLGDITGRRKRLLVISTTAGSLAVCLLFTTQAGGWVWASAIFIAIQLLLNISFTLYDSLLSHVTEASNRDRLSALGYGLGYIGGGIHLAICFYLISSPSTFGLGTGGAATAQATRIALLSAGVWWFIFALPLFFTVPEPAAAPLAEAKRVNPLADTFKRLGDTFSHLRNYRQLLMMLVAFWLYSDGIGTIIGLSTTYGSEQLKLSSTVLLGALLLTQFVAFPYALFFGNIPNPQSKRRSFYVAFILWTVISFPIMGIFLAANEYPEVQRQLAALNAETQYVTISPVNTLIAIAINQVIGGLLSWFVLRRFVQSAVDRITTKNTILLGLGVYVVIAVWAFFIRTPAEFWLLAWLVATVQGGTQALSRSLYSSMTPASKSGEFFGFYALTDKFGSIFGLLLFGVVAQLTGGNLRVSILSVIVFFVAGGLLLARVNEAEGQRLAREEDAAMGYQE